MKEDRFRNVFGSFGGDWKCVSSYGASGLDRICVLWQSFQYSFIITFWDAQMVMGILKEVGSQLKVCVACVYEDSLVQECRVMFDALLVVCAG